MDLQRAQHLSIDGMEWTTADGRTLRMTEMATTHLFFSVRMIWNHSVPEQMRFKPYRRWRFARPASYYAVKLRGLLTELALRDDLPGWMDRQLQEMAARLNEIDRIGHKRTLEIENG